MSSMVEIQTTLETYESMSTSEQNLDISVSEMMKQLIEVTEIISQDRIQQCTLDQINDTSVSQAVKELNEPCKVLSRDRLFNVIVGMKQDDDKGNSMFQTMTQLDDEMAQEALSKMKQAFAENGKKFGMQKLSFEAVERWIHENRSTTQQAVRAQTNPKSFSPNNTTVHNPTIPQQYTPLRVHVIHQRTNTPKQLLTP